MDASNPDHNDNISTENCTTLNITADVQHRRITDAERTVRRDHAVKLELERVPRNETFIASTELRTRENNQIGLLQNGLAELSKQFELVEEAVNDLLLRHSTFMVEFRNFLRDQDGKVTLLHETMNAPEKSLAGCGNPTDSVTFPIAGVKRASGLWYLDGNLIILAGSLVFRVFHGILSEQSPVLQALLSPENLGEYDLFDGCPIVPLSLSNRQAMYLLSAIFKPNFDSRLKRFSFDSIADVHRLGCTYEIPALRVKTLILISSNYPTNLAEFSAVGLGPSYCRDQILPVIRFAREHSVDWILPLAFYRYCLEMTTHTLFYGVDCTGENMVLTTEDQARCHRAHKIMSKANIAEVLARYHTRLNDEGCTGGEACQESRSREADRLLHSLDSVPDLLSCWVPEADSKLCPTCFKATFQWHSGRRQLFWDGLPGLFGLPDWTILNEMKEAALQELTT